MARLIQQTPRVAAAALVALACWAAALPTMSAADRSSRAAAFRFEPRALPERRGTTPRTIRAVHPSLQRIAPWISAVGASIALTDLNGDGLANEACYVDTRFDEVRVAAVDEAERFPSFALRLDGLPYDEGTMAPMGCLPGDFNEDSRIDLLVYFWGRTPLIALRLPGDLQPAAFELQELTDGGERWFTNAATRADVDGDGRADLVFGNYFPDGARVLDAAASGPSETMQHSMTRADNGGGTHIFLWTGAERDPVRPRAHFRQVAHNLPPDIAQRWTLAVGAADLDGDLLPELYFANDFGPDVLLHNRSLPGRVQFAPMYGRRGFWTPASQALGRDSFKGMGVDFADINDDGLQDIYVSNIAAVFALEESHFLFLSTGQVGRFGEGIAPYVDAGERLGLSRSGWAWDAKLDDFDNDGVMEAVQAMGFLRGWHSRWPELQELATGNDQLLRHPQSWPRFVPGDDISGHDAAAFFVRHRDGRYYDIAGLVGLDSPFVSRGIAIADVDGDGRLDLALARQWDRSFVYRNRSPQPGAFLGLHLRRPLGHGAGFEVRPGHRANDTSTTPALGAVVQVSQGDRVVGTREVDGGNGHSGRRSADLHFGVGAARGPLRAAIRWRDSSGTPRRRMVDLEPGWHTIVLGEP